MFGREGSCPDSYVEEQLQKVCPRRRRSAKQIERETWTRERRQRSMDGLNSPPLALDELPFNIHFTHVPRKYPVIQASGKLLSLPDLNFLSTAYHSLPVANPYHPACRGQVRCSLSLYVGHIYTDWGDFQASRKMSIAQRRR